MKTEEKCEMPNVFKVFREGRRKCHCGVCGTVGLEKINFHFSLLCYKRKVLKRLFHVEIIPTVFSVLCL